MMLGHLTLRWERAGPQALSKGAAVFSHGHSQLYWLLARREGGSFNHICKTRVFTQLQSIRDTSNVLTFQESENILFFLLLTHNS